VTRRLGFLSIGCYLSGVTSLPIRRILVTILVLGLYGTAQGAEGSGESSAGGTAAVRLFNFHSNFWVNLHHFLYLQATLSGSQKPSRSTALASADSEELGKFTPSERTQWDEVVAYYTASFVKRDLLFDDDLIAIKNELEDAENSPDLADAKIPSELKRMLLTAAPIYRKHWWMRHDAENQRWIAQVVPLINQYGSKIAERMERIYAQPWPQYPVRVDVTVYANWAGAYTTVHPTRPTIATADAANQGVAALEIVFHETSHGMMDRVMDAFQAAEATVNSHRTGKAFQSGSLWHAVLFYTAGELVQEQIPGYLPYAEKNALWERAWPAPDRALIEKDWKPHTDGSVGLQEAIARLVNDVASAPRPQ